MSVQTELTRITNAKAAIKTAIEGKGITVPAGTLLDGMASLIESIEAGASAFTTGNFTPSEKTYSTIIEHGLGIVPNYLALFIHDETRKIDPDGLVSFITNKSWCRLVWNFKSESTYSSLDTTNDSYYLGSGYPNGWHIFADDSIVDINFGPGIGFIGGKTYEWIAW